MSNGIGGGNLPRSGGTIIISEMLKKISKPLRNYVALRNNVRSNTNCVRCSVASISCENHRTTNTALSNYHPIGYYLSSGWAEELTYI